MKFFFFFLGHSCISSLLSLYQTSLETCIKAFLYVMLLPHPVLDYIDLATEVIFFFDKTYHVSEKKNPVFIMFLLHCEKDLKRVSHTIRLKAFSHCVRAFRN